MVLTGCSSAGELTEKADGTASACAIAIKSNHMRFSVGMGRGISSDRRRAADDIISTLSSTREFGYKHRYGLVLTDALGGYVEDLMDALTRKTAGSHHFFGGGAGDDAKFQKTHVFFGTWAHSDAAVVLEILSERPLGIGAAHGWRPVSPLLTVDKSDGLVVDKIDGRTAADLFMKWAAFTGETLDLKNPIGFFLHNCIGIENGAGFKIRVPLKIIGKGSIAFAAEVPEGSRIAFMRSSARSAMEAAENATRAARSNLGPHKAAAGLFFDCAATRLRLGKEFGAEIEAVSKAAGNVPLAGCNSYGQIMATPNQESGFHNCTAVTCLFPS